MWLDVYAINGYTLEFVHNTKEDWFKSSFLSRYIKTFSLSFYDLQGGIATKGYLLLIVLDPDKSL